MSTRSEQTLFISFDDLIDFAAMAGPLPQPLFSFGPTGKGSGTSALDVGAV